MAFGVHDWAPYAGNSVLITGFFLLADRLTVGLRSWHKACLCVLLMSFPLLARAATTCRPDFAAALLTSAGVFAVAGTRASRWDFIRTSLGRRIAVGAWFGAAVLAKPSVFPSTLAIMCACTGAAAVSHLMTERSRGSANDRSFRRIAKALSPCFATAFLATIPYFALQGRQTLQYIFDNTIGVNAAVWAYPGNMGQVLTFYLIGPGADGMLSGHRLVLVIAATAATLFYARRRRFRYFAAIFPVAAALAVAYAVCTANRMKNEFLGLTFQVCLVFSVVAAIRNLILSQLARRQLPWAEALLLIITLSGVLGFKWPDRVGTLDAAGIRPQTEVAERLFDISRSQVESTGNSIAAPRVFVTFTGRISAYLFNYMALKQHISIQFYDLSVGGDINRYFAALDSADMVITCDPDMGRELSREEVGLVSNYVPNAAFREALLSAIRARSSYTLLAQVPYPSSRYCFYVYKRRSPG